MAFGPLHPYLREALHWAPGGATDRRNLTVAALGTMGGVKR
jgi:hypothetical protein